MIELVTGHAGEGHVSSADHGRFNAGVCGLGKYVLTTGQRFAYTIDSNNLIKIASGDAVNQGRHIIIPQNTVEDAAIVNGVQGKTRIDVIALRYTKDISATPATETASLVVIKGTDVSIGSTPPVPAVTSGDIFDGASVDDMPLYHVLITDTVITSVTPVFKVLDSLSDVSGSVDEIVNGLLDRVYPVGSIYMSVSNANPGTLFGGTWQQIQGKFLLGASTGHTAGSTGGAETVTLSVAQLPAHTHTGPAHTHSVSGHTHSVPNHTHSIPEHTHTATCASAGDHFHNIRRTQDAAAGSAKFSFAGAADTFKPTLNAGAHTHTITVAKKGAFNTNSSGSCTTGSGGAGNTGSAGTGATGSTGSGSAVSIMPPFLSVYMWKRTA